MPSKHLFHFSKQKPHNQTKAGERIKATKENFPALQGMSLYKVTLRPKGIREPHWHANADELGYCLKGQVLVSMFGNESMREKFLVNPGEVFLIPSGYLHTLENVGKGDCELILQFSNEQPEDFGLSSAMGMFSDAVLGNIWDQPEKYFKKLKRSTKETFAALRKSSEEIPEDSHYASHYLFNLEAAYPLISNDGGDAKVARGDVWSILKRQALYSVLITGVGMRDAHWHPDTCELGYVNEGKGRMSILSPNGTVDTYVMNKGDIYFIPKGYPHQIENLTKKPLHIMIFFDNPMPGDIGFTGSVKSNSDEALAAVMNTTPAFFKHLPTYYEDLFFVKKINPLD